MADAKDTELVEKKLENSIPLEEIEFPNEKANITESDEPGIDMFVNRHSHIDEYSFSEFDRADPNADLMAKIFSKLQGTMSVGGNGGRPYNTYLLLENPGTFIDPNLDLSNVSDEHRLSDLLNVIPEPNWVWEPSTLGVSDVYERTLADKELPIHELSPEQRKQVRESREAMDRYEDVYFRYADKYWTAYDQYWTAKVEADARGIPLNPRFQFRLRQAEDRWNNRGRRNVYENAAATLFNLETLDPNRYWRYLSDQVSAAKKNDGGVEFLPTSLNPTYEEIVDPSSEWVKYKFTDADFTYHEHHEHTSSGGGLSVNFGLWRASAGASYSKDEGFEKTSAKNLVLEVEIKRARIYRPWQKSIIYHSRAWRWSSGSIGSSRPITDGRPIGNPMPVGWMPLQPVEVLLARKVRITANFSETERTWLRERLTARASVGWGPFSIGGHYSKTTTDDYYHGRIVGNTIESDGVQIIGWFANSLPRSPDPDPNMNWPTPLSAEDFVPSGYVEDRELLFENNKLFGFVMDKEDSENDENTGN